MYLFYRVHRHFLIPVSKEKNKWSAVLVQLSVHNKMFVYIYLNLASELLQRIFQ